MIKQEAQLSQRDRTTLVVIEYFAKSLKNIRNNTAEYGVCKSLLVFHSSSSSRMRVIYHNWSATKQHPHPQSVAKI